MKTINKKPLNLNKKLNKKNNDLEKNINKKLLIKNLLIY